MKKYIGILRGINVGGKRKIVMSDLKEILVKIGFENVSTYIQSGNIIFTKTENLDNLETAQKIEAAIEKTFGFEVPVIVRSAQELNEIIAQNPFIKDKNIHLEQLHLTFLQQNPDDEKSKQLETKEFLPDQLRIVKNNVYIFCEGKYHQTKINNNFFEKKLNVKASTRNWKTLLKLAELSS